LHDDDVRADADLPVLGGEYGTVQHPGPLAEGHGTTQDSCRGNIRGIGDDGTPPAMFDQHATPYESWEASGTTAVAAISTSCPVYPRHATPISVEECGPTLSPDASTTSQTAESTAVSLLTTYTSEARTCAKLLPTARSCSSRFASTCSVCRTGSP